MYKYFMFEEGRDYAAPCGVPQLLRAGGLDRLLVCLPDLFGVQLLELADPTPARDKTPRCKIFCALFSCRQSGLRPFLLLSRKMTHRCKETWSCKGV